MFGRATSPQWGNVANQESGDHSLRQLGVGRLRQARAAQAGAVKMERPADWHLFNNVSGADHCATMHEDGLRSLDSGNPGQRLHGTGNENGLQAIKRATH